MAAGNAHEGFETKDQSRGLKAIAYPCGEISDIVRYLCMC